MAPNNALKKVTPTTPTTVLESGTVEARGMGTKATSREIISQEIIAFLEGEAKLSFQSETRAFFTVWTFITRLPGPSWVDHHPGFLMRGMAYFPIAGSLVGVFVGAFFDVCNTTLGLPPIIAGVFCTAASLWITGCFHEDGLADASDGIGGGWSRSQILRIMSDTRLGTYGCAVLMLYLVAKLQLLAALGPSEWSFHNSHGAAPALLLSHTFARLTSPYLIRTNDYADEGGPKFAFYSFMLQAKYLVTWWRVAFAALTCVALGSAVVGLAQTLTLLLGMWLLAHFAGRYANYLLGGVMGDYLGATICVSEVLTLTLLLINESVAHFLTTIIDEVMTTESVDQLTMSWENPKFTVLARFGMVLMTTVLWSRNVGPPDVFIRETAISNIEKNDGEIRIGLNDNWNETTPEQQETNRAKVERTCQNKDASFSDRYEAISSYLDSLAKPKGSLATLEEWAARLGALQKTSIPEINSVACLIFAADHGIAKQPEEGGEGCSAYPQIVTQGVLKGLDMGVAGASVLARANNVKLRVVDAGVVGTSEFNSDVVVQSSFRLTDGTRNCCKSDAMTAEEVELLLAAGRMAMKEYVKETNADVLCLGEVGIGNTTTSSILLAAITGEDPSKLVDGGATLTRQVDHAAVEKKIGIVKKALRNHAAGTTPMGISSILAKFGGAEIVAIVGAILQASEHNMPVLVDGFIVTVAALAATLLSPSAVRVLFFATQSAEKGHAVAVDKICQVARLHNFPVPAMPALSMQLRMGEGTGAILAVPLLRCAAMILREMATLDQIIGDS
jgi:nicotinate-nucleotide--dimethylbenzimidazole phosphoribosyltransferase